MFGRLDRELNSLWHADAPGVQWRWPWVRQFLRFWIVVVQGFIRSRCPVRASALAYSSILAFIPLLAVAVGVSTSLLQTAVVPHAVDPVIAAAPGAPQPATTPTVEDPDPAAVPPTTIESVVASTSSVPAEGAVPAVVDPVRAATDALEVPLEVSNQLALAEAVKAAETNAPSTSTPEEEDLSEEVSESPIPSPEAITRTLAGTPENKIREWINDILVKVAPQLQNSTEVGTTLDAAVDQMMEMIGNVNGGTIGATGFVTLLAVILFMLARIEETLNDIWGVAKGRSWYARVVNYWAAITLGPILIISALGLSTSLRLETTQEWLVQKSVLLAVAVELLPILALSIVCALFNGLMPNTRVRWDAAAVGGGVAGLLWHLNNVWSVEFTAQLSRYGKIYSSLAIVPIFMMGLYLFWLLLLFGAQVSYTWQNRLSYLAMRESVQVHQEGRETAAVRVMLEVARAYRSGQKPPTLSTLAQRLSAPGPLLEDVRQALVDNGLVLETANREPRLLPGRPAEDIRIADILRVMRRGGAPRLTLQADPLQTVAEREMSAVLAAEQQAGNRTLAELVGTRLEPAPGESVRKIAPAA